MPYSTEKPTIYVSCGDKWIAVDGVLDIEPISEVTESVPSVSDDFELTISVRIPLLENNYRKMHGLPMIRRRKLRKCLM